MSFSFNKLPLTRCSLPTSAATSKQTLSVPTCQNAFAAFLPLYQSPANSSTSRPFLQGKRGLVLAVSFPPPGHVRDLHPLERAHGALTKKRTTDLAGGSVFSISLSVVILQSHQLFLCNS